VSQLVAALAAVQLVAQLPPVTHRYPEPQPWVATLQTSADLQVPAVLYWKCVSLGQVVVTAVQVVRSSQPPPPSHLPVSPQEPVAAATQEVALRGVLPPAILEQVPTLPETMQLWQALAQAWSQQTFSLEHTSPVEQSLSALQVSPPPSLSPHLLLVRRQVRPFAQSLSELHVLRQLGLAVLQT
jgi:hypothetical protein